MRWRLIKSPVGVYRRQVLAAMCDADCLGCACASHASAVLTLLRTDHKQLRSELLRLASAMASDALGRSYLLQNAQHLIAAIFKVLQAMPEARVKAHSGELSCILKLQLLRGACSLLSGQLKSSILILCTCNVVAARPQGSADACSESNQVPGTLHVHDRQPSMFAIIRHNSGLQVARAGTRRCTATAWPCCRS